MTLDQRLHTTLVQTRADLAHEWPEVLTYVPTVSKNTPTPTRNPAEVLDTDTLKVSQEERSQTQDQLRAIAALPPEQFDAKTAQELALKLSFLLGHHVTFTRLEKNLTFSHGTIRAVATMKDFSTLWPADPTSSPRTQSKVKNDTWSIWVSPRDFSTTARADWNEPWFLHQRVLVINPQTMRAVVATIGGILTTGLNRYQFGASRSVLQAGQFWTPRDQGRCLVCFLEESLPNGTVISFSGANA